MGSWCLVSESSPRYPFESLRSLVGYDGLTGDVSERLTTFAIGTDGNEALDTDDPEGELECKDLAVAQSRSVYSVQVLFEMTDIYD